MNNVRRISASINHALAAINNFISGVRRFKIRSMISSGSFFVGLYYKMHKIGFLKKVEKNIFVGNFPNDQLPIRDPLQESSCPFLSIVVVVLDFIGTIKIFKTSSA